MYKLEVEWSFKVYIDAESVEEAEDKFRLMSWEEVFRAGRENGIHEEYETSRAGV